MESLDNIINLLLRPEAYIASKDLMDAFFSVPNSAAHQKYLKILFAQVHQFDCRPNGYGPMRAFTKST